MTRARIIFCMLELMFMILGFRGAFELIETYLNIVREGLRLDKFTFERIKGWLSWVIWAAILILVIIVSYLALKWCGLCGGGFIKTSVIFGAFYVAIFRTIVAVAQWVADNVLM